jgi:hypothetical protein
MIWHHSFGSRLEHSMQDVEQAIRERAYHFWLADGRPSGNAEAYWFAAQREILATSLGSFAPLTAPQAGAMQPSKKEKATRKRRAG